MKRRYIAVVILAVCVLSLFIITEQLWFLNKDGVSTAPHCVSPDGDDSDSGRYPDCWRTLRRVNGS